LDYIIQSVAHQEDVYVITAVFTNPF